MGREAIIVGAGLAGSLLAVSLARAGWRVTVFERRGDPREVGGGGGRSINLAVSARGIAGLASVGLDREILGDHAIPMPGRMIHSREGGAVFQPYSKNPAEAINSFSRGGLNLALIRAAARESAVTLCFRRPCLDVDFEGTGAVFGDAAGGRERRRADLIVGADGAYSAVRLAMQKTDRFEYSQSYLGHGYKELRIPSGPDGSPAIERHALHIWPRGGAMMIALPNTDGSFTNTLFWPWEGEHSFEALEGEWRARRRGDPSAAPSSEELARVAAFFAEQYPDAARVMPTLVADFFANPTGSLVTVRCSPWRRGRVAVLGDAAHAIVPFFGQGMNASFEDVVCLTRMLTEHQDVEEALAAYEAERKPNADAIADMALENFTEMRDRVGTASFRYRKRIEQAIHEMFEDRVTPRYNLVSFSTVPYVEARRRGDELDAVVSAVAERVPPETLADEDSWRRMIREQARVILGGEPPGGPPTESARLVDLSPVVSPRLGVWPGDTPPSRRVLLDIETGSNITLSTLTSTVHLGSHADGPNHYGRGAASIDRIPLDRYIGPCQVLDARAPRGRRVGVGDVEGLEGVRTRIVLLRTGTFPDPEKWNEDFAGLSVELVADLAGRGVRTLGVDTPSVDLFSSKDLEAHREVLRHGMVILEGLVLGGIEAGPDRLYELIAPPLRLEGFDASPVRAVLRPWKG
ncbi:MAG: FAD-dependent monooxygenase [Phycisphaeraceae bacterium]|nr:FAD-dependent monooxygenase [Phycisphaerae bacterium]MBX3391536.1 FAD-dependent monooxygenase [Phycisphaeraceae bacterium]